MENEVYIEESNPHRARRTIIILVIVVTICFIVFLMLKERYTLNLKRIEVEVGDKVSDDLSFYIKNKILDSDDYKLYLDDIPHTDNVYTTVGKYTYKVKYKNITKKGVLVVKDDEAPSVKIQELTIGVDEDYEVDWFLTSCEDYSKPCLVTYENEKDEFLHSKAGKYTFDIVISDNVGNEVEKRVTLNVKKGYSLQDTKISDKNIKGISSDYGDWHKEMFETFSKGITEENLGVHEDYHYLYDLTESDLILYLPYDYIDNEIREHELLYVYNSYDYVIGVAIRVKLDNGKYLYLTK